MKLIYSLKRYYKTFFPKWILDMFDIDILMIMTFTIFKYLKADRKCLYSDI